MEDISIQDGVLKYVVPNKEVIEIPEEDLPAAPFADIAGYDWAATAINGLRQKNIIKGDGSGTYRPGDNMTREEYYASAAYSHRVKPDVAGLICALLKRDDITDEQKRIIRSAVEKL